MHDKLVFTCIDPCLKVLFFILRQFITSLIVRCCWQNVKGWPSCAVKTQGTPFIRDLAMEQITFWRPCLYLSLSVFLFVFVIIAHNQQSSYGRPIFYYLVILLTLTVTCSLCVVGGIKFLSPKTKCPWVETVSRLMNLLLFVRCI